MLMLFCLDFLFQKMVVQHPFTKPELVVPSFIASYHTVVFKRVTSCYYVSVIFCQIQQGKVTVSLPVQLFSPGDDDCVVFTCLTLWSCHNLSQFSNTFIKHILLINTLFHAAKPPSPFVFCLKKLLLKSLFLLL